MKLRLGIRSKLFLISFAIIVVMALVSGVFLETRLRSWLEDRIATEISQNAAEIAVLINSFTPERNIETYDYLADNLGSVISARVTFIASDGSVLGDSVVPFDEIHAMRNYLDRPEVIAALQNQTGELKRFSSVPGASFIYVAVPIDLGDGEIGAVTLAMQLSDVERAVANLRTLIFVASLIGLAVAGVMVALTSHFTSGTLRNLTRLTKDIAEGKSRHHLHISSEDEIGGLAGSINTMADEIERVVGELAWERDHLEAVLEGMDDAVIALDKNRTITLLNTSAKTLINLRQDFIGKSLMEAVRVPTLLNAVTQPGKSGTTSIEFDLPVAPPKRILAHISSQRLGDGTIIVMTDVTEIKKLETARRDFISNASHELRTPVGIIQANAETLLNGAILDTDKSIQFLEAIYRNSIRLSNLINDLLQISRIEEGKYHLNLSSVNISEIAKSVTAANDYLAHEKNITITHDFPSDLNALADPRALEDILFNLVDNAVKYSPEGGTVIIRAYEANNTVTIEVEDNGYGIPQKDRERIFERFYRVDTGRSREMGGTGLGLSIVKHLTIAMGGNVAVRPAEPHGSIFTVNLKNIAH